MFYKTGVDITNDKQMFNFLKNHFEYWTMNSWNRAKSIANNVKMYNLGLSGDWYTALKFLEADEYYEIENMIRDWECDHYHYTVGFNGRSGGYLVLMGQHHNDHVLPEWIVDCDTYEDYKDYCREYYGTVKCNRPDLVFYVRLVQDFDRLCDQMREYCDELSNRDFAVQQMEEIVWRFNEGYIDDLMYLGFNDLTCEDGIVNVSEIMSLQCLWEAFCAIVRRVCADTNYELKYIDDKNNVKLGEK